MSENEQFEPDCNDRHSNTYNYSVLNSRYEANVERNEIIEWNKEECNAQYVGMERIAEALNFKQMQLEKCRKGYKELMDENKELKQTNQRLKDNIDELLDIDVTEDLLKKNNELEKKLVFFKALAERIY